MNNIFSNSSRSNVDLFEAIASMLKVDTQKEEKKVKDYKFAVLADTIAVEKVEALLTYARSNGLTISGDGTNETRWNNQPVGRLAMGEVLLFGTDDRFDIIRVSASTASTKYGKLRGYSVVFDYNEIKSAIKGFAKEKSRLLDKYPVNSDSRTLYEMTLLEKGKSKASKCSCESKRNVRTDITVMPDWVKVGTQFISKNAADTVVITDRNTRTTIPGRQPASRNPFLSGIYYAIL